MKMKKLILTLLFSTSTLQAEQTNLYEVAKYDEAHVVSTCDKKSIKKRAHLYSTRNYRLKLENQAENQWINACITDYKSDPNGDLFPIYNTSCVLQMRETFKDGKIVKLVKGLKS